MPVVRGVADRSAHEVRNALNGMVVNLEVVRSRFAGAEAGLGPAALFLEQAIGQSEESVRLVEPSLALLDLLLGAVDARGEIQCELLTDCTVRFRTSETEAARVVRSLQPLASRAGVGVETDGPAVILTISPRSSAEENIQHE